MKGATSVLLGVKELKTFPPLLAMMQSEAFKIVFAESITFCGNGIMVPLMQCLLYIKLLLFIY